MLRICRQLDLFASDKFPLPPRLRAYAPLSARAGEIGMAQGYAAAVGDWQNGILRAVDYPFRERNLKSGI